MLENVKQTVQDTADNLGDLMQERKTDMKFDARLKAIERNISQVDSRIEALGKRFPRTRGPRFPLGLVLVAGIGYVLYNASTRKKVLELVGNVSPAARDSIEGLLGSADDAVADVKGGRTPGEAIGQAARNVGQQARDGVQDVKNDLEQSGGTAAGQASGAVTDAKRGVDRLADKAQDKLNDVKH
ncbi:hypothetical protein [Deinococcus sp.]|uniref:hypothetical protein n=1 Tax=Deinococcus sp. TaxID=47478 RepID=UPI003C7C5F03